MGIGKIDLRGLHPLVVAMPALQLDIEPVAEHLLQEQKPLLGERPMVGAERGAHRPPLPAREADDAFGQRRQPRSLDHGRRAGRHVEIGARDEAHEIGVPLLRGRDENERMRLGTLIAAGLALLLAAGIRKQDVELAADDRLHAVLRRLLGEF